MTLIIQRHCFQHPEREAVARCLECGESFCRECITEHGERLICASCLTKVARAAKPHAGHRWRETLLPLAGAGTGVLVSWLVFYALARLLMHLPTAFHQAQIWGGAAE